MTAIREIGHLEQIAENTPLAQSKLWDREIETVRPAEVYAFIYRNKLQGKEAEARQSVDMMLSELRTAIARREVGGSFIERLSAFDTRMTRGDVRVLLSSMTRERALATLFTLEADVLPEQIATVRWSHVLKSDLSERAREVLSLMPRHIRTDLVFWEYDESRLSPLFALKPYIEQKAGMTWEWLQVSYASRIDIDFDLDFAALRKELAIG